MEKLTHHGKRRLKERVGAGKSDANKLSYRARTHGLEFQDCEGELATWLFRKRLKCGAVAKIYGKKVYIFSKEDVLITVFPLPEEFEDLEKFVKPEAWKRYTHYVGSFRREQSGGLTWRDMGSDLKDPNTIKTILNRHIKAEGIDFLVIKVLRVGNSYMAYFVSDCPKRDSIYISPLCEWAKANLKICVCFEHRKNSDGRFILKSDYLEGDFKTAP